MVEPLLPLLIFILLCYVRSLTSRLLVVCWQANRGVHVFVCLRLSSKVFSKQTRSVLRPR